jgi:two-component system OmpR family response regulator
MPFKIFIIDDDAVMQTMIRDFLASKYSDSELSVFTSGENALVELYRKPDVIVLDYHLDVTLKQAMNGIDILKRIKELLPNVPVIFLSGNDNPTVAANTIQYGAYDYIVKNENAFHRLEIMINNSTGHMTVKKQLGLQKSFNVILLVLLAAVLLSVLLSRFI